MAALRSLTPEPAPPRPPTAAQLARALGTTTAHVRIMAERYRRYVVGARHR